MSFTEHEPYEVSARFFDAVQAKALSLETNARQDEEKAAVLEHPEHVQRQHRLVRAQRRQAERLRLFLASARVRAA